MEKITFECEVVTPMFLAGADGKTPELRPPSIKGAMRFWWRAIHGNLSLEELKEQEADIFGGIPKEKENKNSKIGKSGISIKITRNIHYDGNYKYRPLPHSESKKFSAAAFPPREIFGLKLFFKNNISREFIENLFRLTSILGGLGKRSRRGFGSFRLLSIDNEVKNWQISAELLANLLNSISNNFEWEENSVRIDAKGKEQYPFIESIALGKEYNSYEELLKRIGEATHKHACDSLGFAHSNDRLASPIYVSIIQVSDRYRPIITTLNTAFEKNKSIDVDKQKKFKEMIL